MSAATLKPAEIKVRKGHNVRANGNDADFDKSVATLGVLVPLLVEQDGSDYYLVAGHRRLTAAKKAKLEQVPVAVVDYGAGETATRDSAAAVENISRSQLNKVEEAMAVKRLLDSGHFTDQGVREVLGVSAKWVTERKLILEVPESWHPMIADGYVNAQELRLLVSIAKVSEKLADALLAFNKKEYKDGCRIDGWAIAQAVDEAKGLWLVGGYGGFDPASVDLPDEAKEKLPKLADTSYGYRREWRPEFHTGDLDRLRAAGVLWESDEKSGYHRTVVATDVELLRDIVVEKIAKARPPKKTAGSAGSGSGEKGADAEKQLKDKRKKLREKIAELQTTARGLNLELGSNLIKGLAKVKLTPDLADFVLARIVYHPDERASVYSAAPSLGWAVEELAHGGMRYCHPDYQTEETLKSGKAKITYLDKDEAGKKLSAWMKAAKTPEEKLGRLVIAVALAEYAVDEVVPSSRRFPRSGAYHARDALAKIVDGHLPTELEQTRKALVTAESQLQRLQ